MNLIQDEPAYIDLHPGKEYVVFLAGNFGGGSVALFLGDRENVISIEMPDPVPSAITESTTFVFTAPVTTLIAALEGSTGANVILHVTPLQS